MPGFRMKLNELPEQPGERRISVHWFFLPAALFYLAGGIACLREYPHAKAPQTLMYGGWFCIFLSLFTLLTFILCLKQIRIGRPVKSLFTIRLRMLILVGTMAGLMMFSFDLSRFLPAGIAWVLPFIWVFGGGFIWNGIVRYFRNHPPKN